jgi:arginine decarboxylase
MINKERQAKAPLLDALANYRDQGVIRLHMPGHKGGRNLDPQVRELLGEKAFILDITGVEGMDDLHQPQGVIKASQELLAEAFGADQSYFLVNGTSSGVQALLLALCNPGDKVVVPRNMHKSMIAGVIFSGAHPVFVTPTVSQKRGIAFGVTLDKIKQTLHMQPDIKGVLLINPTYYGTTTELEEIKAFLQQKNIPLLLDEAHGPHFYFHSDFPTPGLAAGADGVAQGMHKLLGGLTQGSILHLQGKALDQRRLEASLRLLQSTSASYLLMASLEGARRQMALHGQELLTEALHLARWAREEINTIPGLSCFGREARGVPGFVDLDETKLTITVKELGLTGQQVEQILRYQYNVQVELSDLYNILLMVTIGSTEEDIARLLSGLRQIAARRKEFPANRELLARAEELICETWVPELVILPRDAFFAPSRAVKLQEAVGEISAEVVTAYPPGIPIICPGERITAEIAAYLALITDAKLRISGPQDTSLEYIQVVSCKA